MITPPLVYTGWPSPLLSIQSSFLFAYLIVQNSRHWCPFILYYFKMPNTPYMLIIVNNSYNINHVLNSMKHSNYIYIQAINRNISKLTYCSTLPFIGNVLKYTNGKKISKPEPHSKPLQPVTEKSKNLMSSTHMKNFHKKKKKGQIKLTPVNS